MSDLNPPPIPGHPGQPPGLPPVIETDPSELVPIQSTAGAVEALLRQPGRVVRQLREKNHRSLIAALLVVAIVSSLIYGLVVGSFAGGEQLWAAPVKIAAGLILSALICLPSLYIFSCLSGSQARLSDVIGLVAALLALASLLLIGFAPVAWVFSQSTHSVPVMGGLHLAFWLIAFYFGARFLSAGFQKLNASSSGGIHLWLAIFLIVALQMTAALRPILERSDTFLPVEKKFFLGHWFDTIEGRK